MFLKNRNISSKIKRPKVTDYAALNHKLPVVDVRFWGVDRVDRICELCFLNRLGDEYHYVSIGM